MSNQRSNEERKVRLAESEAAAERSPQSELDSDGSRWRLDRAHGELDQAARKTNLADEVAELKATVQTLRAEISERNRAEAELKTLSRFYENVRVGLCSLDLDLRYVHINEWLAAINGISVQEHLGRTIRQVLPEVAAGVELQLRQVIETGEPILDGTVKATTPADPSNKRTFQHSYLPVKSDDDTIIGVTCVVQDVTERRQAEQALKRSERELRLITDNVAASIAYLDSSQCYRFVNNRYVEIVGVGREEMIGCHLKDVIGKAAYDTVREHVEKALSGEHVEYEANLPLRSGKNICVRVTYVPDSNGPKSVQGIFVLAHDITERKQADILLRQRERELAHVVRLNSMGQMVGEIAHEINQPLFAISNFAKACTKRLETGNGDKEEIIQWTRRIDRIATMASKILNRVKDFLADKANARSTFDLNEVLAEAIDLVSFNALRSEVIVRFEPSQSRLDVCADRVQIQQVLVNLMRNACEAMEDYVEGERRVTTRVSRKGEYLEITVEDNGPGISAETADRLFDTFFTTKKNGMGMGLAVCRSIVEDHGGTIGTVRAVGHGAAFRFTLPLATEGGRDER